MQQTSKEIYVNNLHWEILFQIYPWNNYHKCVKNYLRLIPSTKSRPAQRKYLQKRRSFICNCRIRLMNCCERIVPLFSLCPTFHQLHMEESRHFLPPTETYLFRSKGGLQKMIVNTFPDMRKHLHKHPLNKRILSPPHCRSEQVDHESEKSATFCGFIWDDF